MAKLSEKSLINFAMAYFYAAIRAFRARMAEVETTLQRFHTLLGELNTLWTAFDDAYKRSTKSLLTEEIARLDTERDHYAAVVKETAKLWANHFKDVDETLAIRGRRVLQPFIDQRSMESAGIEKGELRAAREALYAKYLELVEYINAVQVIQPEDSLGGAVLYYNADLKKIEEQIAQGGSQPTVLVRSEVVGNHRYSVPEFSKWEDIVLANEKAFVIDGVLNRVLSASAKAKKVGGLFLALNGTAVKPTDAVDASNEYELVEIGGSTSGGGSSEPEVTPVTPE